MREIKFRAWDKECERMFYDITIKNIIEQTLELDGHWLNETDHILMQYTGLKDKNGKDIYEGDIVAENFNSFKDTHIVQFKDCGITPFYETDSDGDIFFFRNDECEVIGNIYENPELIKY